MRFDVNLSMLFTEVPFLERFERAARAGFGAVELWWPAGEDLDEVVRTAQDANLEVVLLGFSSGDMAAGDRGLLSDPEREHLVRENVPVALDLAGRLGCRRMTALVGLEVPGMERAEQLALAKRNVEWAADRARGIGIEVLVEQLNPHDNGPYLLPEIDQAVEFVRSLERENVRLQYDAYHVQVMRGAPGAERELLAGLREYLDLVSHVQIADWPGRGEPGSGRFDYGYFLPALDALGYNGYVGLEYRPTTPSTEASLEWLPRHLRRGDVSADTLDL